MKRITLLFIAVTISLSSCNTDKVISSGLIQKKYNQGYYISSFAKNKKVKTSNEHKTETKDLIPIDENPLISAQSNTDSNTEESSSLTASANNDKGISIGVNTIRKDFKKIQNEIKHKILEGECDVITLKTGDEIKAKVIEITNTEIKYKKCDNINGPTVSLNKSEVFMIKYANGTKEMITSKEAKNNTNTEIRNNSSDSYSDETKRTSGLAIASFICGLLWVLLVLLAYGTVNPMLSIITLLSGIFAFIFGLVALSRIKKHKNLKGKGLAVTGVILGTLYLLLLVIGIALIASLL